MPALYERLQEGFATVYLTLTSVVIALALEKLFDRMVAVATLPPWDLADILTWLQGGSVLVAAFTMFVIVSYLVLALRWDISVLDAAAPFVLLIFLAGAITSIGHGHGTAFFLIVGVGQIGSGPVLARIMKEAEGNPVNEMLLRSSDFRTTYAVGTLAGIVSLAAAILLSTGVIGSLGAVVAAALLLLCMLGLVQSFSRSWWRVIREVGSGGPDDTAADAPETL